MRRKKSFWKILSVYIVLVIVGVVINYSLSGIAQLLSLPLYMDSVGTMSIAALGGVCPGMIVGFISNMIGGLKDSSTFYYGTVNVLIALIAGYGNTKGYFDRPLRLFKLLGFFMLLSIPCSLLTFILFSCEIGENVATPYALFFYGKGLPVLLSQILGDFCVEIPDKSLSLLLSFLILRFLPKGFRARLFFTTNRIDRRKTELENTGKSSLRSQVAMALILSGIAIAFVAFSISYKTYMEANVTGYPDDYEKAELRLKTFLYSSKMLSAVMGLLMCIVSFFVEYVDRRVIEPLLKMTREMQRFAECGADGEKRNKAVERIGRLGILTGNEIETLYKTMDETVRQIDAYIDKVDEQNEQIRTLNVNTILLLADIVESRDEDTGFHVKRTAEYSALLAKGLRDKGLHTDILTDEYMNTIRIAAALHDIGKIRISDLILNKPARLSEEEFAVMKTHTTMGLSMLEQACRSLGETPYLLMAKDIAHYHHEWYDGSKMGYPEQIKGEDIPLSARIMAVADVFDALVSKRAYKKPYPAEKAFQIMKEESGTHFDPAIIDVMLSLKEKMVEIMNRYQ